jgi:RNA polymerase sigma-70 factor (ECF subfamily)
MSNNLLTQEELDAIVKRDTAMLYRIAQKDVSAFQEFYRTYSGLVFCTIANVLNDHQDSEDVMQEVLVQIWQKAHLYESAKGKPLTWVTTMARNRAIDRIRSKQRRSRLNTDFEQEHKAVQPEFVESTADLVLNSERQSIVRGAVKGLTADQREAIEMTYFDEKTQAEVADELHEPLGTIKARIRRGVSRLETMVKACQ